MAIGSCLLGAGPLVHPAQSYPEAQPNARCCVIATAGSVMHIGSSPSLALAEQHQGSDGTAQVGRAGVP